MTFYPPFDKIKSDLAAFSFSASSGFDDTYSVSNSPCFADGKL